METNAPLALMILVKQRERNEAIGIRNDPQFVRGLTQFIDKHNSDVAEVVTVGAEALYLHALIGEYQKLAEIVTNHIMDDIDNQETRTEGLRAMTAIESYVNLLGERLEELWPT